MSNKDFDKDYLSPKEFAELVGTSPSTLRRYDNSGIFPAAKHGNKNYRGYDPMQITTFKMVSVLSDLGMSIREIERVSNNRNPEYMLKLLSKHKYEVSDRLHHLQEAFSVISTYIEMLIYGLSATESEIYVSEMPEIRIALGERNDFTNTNGFLSEYIRFCREVHNPIINLSYPIGGYFDDMAAFQNEPSQPTRFFSLDSKGSDLKKSGMYLVGYTRGYYGVTNDLPERMKLFAEENGYIFSGPVYNIYLFNEISISEPEQYLLHVTASVVDARSGLSSKQHHLF